MLSYINHMKFAVQNRNASDSPNGALYSYALSNTVHSFDALRHKNSKQ